MKIQATKPVRIPIQAVYRRDEVLSILQCDSQTWEEMQQWNLSYVSLEQLLKYLRRHGVKYELSA